MKNNWGWLFRRSVMYNSLQPHGLQHARLPYPSPSPGVCSNSRPLCWWCHPSISSSVTPFSSCPQSFPASGSFPISWLFPSGSQLIRASAVASVLPMNIQSWFPLASWSPCCPRDADSLLQYHSSKASIFWFSAFFLVQLSHPYMTTAKTMPLAKQECFGINYQHYFIFLFL